MTDLWCIQDKCFPPESVRSTSRRVCLLSPFINRHQIPAPGTGWKESEGWGEVSADHISLSLSLSFCLPAVLPTLLRILYRAIRPRRGPDKQEPLDWKQLCGIRKVCVPVLGSGTRACVCQCVYMYTGVYVCVSLLWALIFCAAARVCVYDHICV